MEGLWSPLPPRGARRVALAIALLLACPATSAAVTVSVSTSVVADLQYARDIRTTQLDVVAADGEVNDVTVSVDAAGFTVRDEGLAPSVGSGCEHAGAGSVRCDAPTPRRNEIALLAARVVLRDGDDRALARAIRGAQISVLGGAGSDVLSAAGQGIRLLGGPGDDALIGGAGGDVLIGGPGTDAVAGGPGDDTVTGGGPVDDRAGAQASAHPDGPDVLDGGAGHDATSYADARTPLYVDLALLSAQEGVGGDALRSVEDVVGGQANDTVYGDEKANALEGGAGVDRLYGRAGADRLDGEIVEGGTGDDAIVSQGAAPVCGPGDDLVGPLFAIPALATILPADCERVVMGLTVVLSARPLAIGSGRLAYRVRSGESGAPRIGLEVRDALSHRLLAYGRPRLPRVGRAPRSGRVSVALTRAGRRAFAGGRHPQVRVRVRDTDGSISGFTART